MEPASEDWQRAGAYITDVSILWRRSNPFKLQKEYGLRRNLEPAKEILDNVMVDVRCAGIKEPQSLRALAPMCGYEEHLNTRAACFCFPY
jgi:hypothetical protein